MDIGARFTSTPPRPWADADAFLAAQPSGSGSGAERAVAAGLAADRVGYAFLSGYHAACDALMGRSTRPAMCVTEKGPPHPRHIECRWSDGVLNGTKTYVTGGPLAQTLHVLAVADGGEKTKRLVVATIAADARGVEIDSLPKTPFVPEVPHGRVRFVDAVPTAVVEDGWSGRVKPFRTVEDIHVTLAVGAYLAQALHRQGGANEDVDALCALIHSLSDLSRRPPSEPGTHRALAGVLALATPLWARATLTGDEGVRWQRDRRLLAVAQGARQARRDAAWVATGAR